MVNAGLIDGKAHAGTLRAALATASADFTARSGIRPTLRVILLGEHPASMAYVGTKARLAAAGASMPTSCIWPRTRAKRPSWR